MQVALAVLENPAVRVALAVLENRVVPAALARQAVAALLNQVEVVEKEAQIRSVAINRRRGGGGGGAFAGGSGSSAKAASNRGGSSMKGRRWRRLAAAWAVAAAWVAAAAWAAVAADGRRRHGRWRTQKISKRLMEEDPMKRKSNITSSAKILGSAILISGFVAVALHSALAAKTDAAATQQVKQKEFDTPQQASDSLVQAAASFDMPVLKEILGPESADLVTSQDPVEDKNRAAAFAAKAKEKNSIATDAKNPNRAVLTIGNDNFPFPIPIVKQNGKW